MTRDEQEAGSRRYGNDVIILLPLESGNVAVLNCCREVCGIVNPAEWAGEHLLALLTETWHPSPIHNRPKTISLEELGLV